MAKPASWTVTVQSLPCSSSLQGSGTYPAVCWMEKEDTDAQTGVPSFYGRSASCKSPGSLDIRALVLPLLRLVPGVLDLQHSTSSA